jgi:hypothetical protein
MAALLAPHWARMRDGGLMPPLARSGLAAHALNPSPRGLGVRLRASSPQARCMLQKNNEERFCDLREEVDSTCERM